MSPRTLFRPYAALFAVPGARALTLAGFLARLPMPMVGLGIVLLVSAILAGRPRADEEGAGSPSPLAVRLRLDASYPTPEGRKHYHVRGVPLGFVVDRVASAQGAGRTGLNPLIELTTAAGAGDAFVIVALAGTIFFNTSVDQARGKVVLFLLVTMAPFAVLGP